MVFRFERCHFAEQHGSALRVTDSRKIWKQSRLKRGIGLPSGSGQLRNNPMQMADVRVGNWVSSGRQRPTAWRHGVWSLRCVEVRFNWREGRHTWSSNKPPNSLGRAVPRSSNNDVRESALAGATLCHRTFGTRPQSRCRHSHRTAPRPADRSCRAAPDRTRSRSFRLAWLGRMKARHTPAPITGPQQLWPLHLKSSDIRNRSPIGCRIR